MAVRDEHAEAADVAQFEHFGDPAVYTPASAPALPELLVIRVRESDTDPKGGRGGAVVWKEMVEVRRSVLAQPAAGDALDILDEPGGAPTESFTVKSFEPDDERRVWRLVLQRS